MYIFSDIFFISLGIRIWREIIVNKQNEIVQNEVSMDVAT